MPGPAPPGFLRAACEAFPFASDASHAGALLALHRTDSGLLKPSTRHLAAALEDWLRPRARGVSLEAIRLLRDQAWFDGGPDHLQLADYLVLLARRHLARRGARVALRTEPEPGQHLEHFRWLSLLLPPDLLVAGFAADANVEPENDHVDLLTPQLARILEGPVAETHLHVGAAFSFGLLWTGLVASLAHHPPDPRRLERGGTPPFGDGRRFLSVLQGAAVVRILLAAFLWRRELSGGPASFRAFLSRDLPGDERDGIAGIAGRTAWAFGPADFTHTCATAIRAVITGECAASPARLASLHRHLRGPTRTDAPRTIDDFLRADPLAAWLVPGPGCAPPETRFTARALRYLRRKGRDDDDFARTFWQYQRIRALTYRYLTVEPGTSGLDWFQQHYDRISALRGTLDGVRFEAAVRLSGRGVRLAALEARTAPEPAWWRIRDLSRGAAVPRIVEDRPEVGLILHFLKQREHRTGNGSVLHADPRQRAHGCRFGAHAYARLKEALAIETALDHMPELLLVLRGVDVASSELAVPTWVLVPLLRRVRDASHRAATALARLRPSWKVEPLRATFHAGEDFRSLAEGLRRIHEPLEFELLCAGDRIGHGLAAGVDPRRWARDHATTIQPAEDRLDDLLWEIDRYQHGDLPADASRVERARADARTLTFELYRRAEDLDKLIAARRRRHDPVVLDRIGYPFTRGLIPIPSDPLDTLVHEHLTDAGLFLRGQRPVQVDADEGEVKFLAEAGRWLRREIARREMTIETNPSSNLLIGDMGSVEEHPAFRFQPVRQDHRDGEEPVHMSINTDDPITFASSIGDEFAYLYGALLRAGIGAHDALTWLDRRREDGWSSRFTLPASARIDVALELVHGDPRGRTPARR